jgi:hypothetical protein
MRMQCKRMVGELFPYELSQNSTLVSDNLHLRDDADLHPCRYTRLPLHLDPRQYLIT